MVACRQWVQGTLQPALASRIRTTLGETGWQLEVDPDMPDGQCLLFHYPTVFPPSSAAYVRPVVKIELGARSDDWPHEEKTILPYVTGHFSTLDPAPPFPVRVLAAERTFWEKACLLHEETFRLTPPTEHLADWRSDYAAMIGPMFFGNAPDFEEILATAADFEKAFNAGADK